MIFNPDIHIRLFEAQDAFNINVRPEDQHIKKEPYFEAWATENAKGAGYTGIRKSDGRILGCGGIRVLWPGCGEAWGIYSDEIGKYAKEARDYAIHYLSELAKALNLHRLQCIVDADNKINVRFARSIGFEVEALMHRYQPNGHDCYMLSFLPGPAITKPLQLGIAPRVFSSLRLRDKMQVIEDTIMSQEDAMMGDAFPLKHSFAKGLYVRQITVPSGVLLTGKIHKHSHAFFLLKGEISVLQDGGVKRIKAPATFITPAGTKRVVYHHSDTIVTTVHATDETDISKIEEEIIAKTWEEFDALAGTVDMKQLGEVSL